MNNSNFYFIDKPINFSSFDIIRILKKKLGIKKIWHTWTLDPLATGCLLIATGSYTRLISYLENDSKEYEFEVTLNWVSDSFDLWEKVDFISTEKQKYYEKKLNIKDIQNILLDNFKWKIEQTPPKYSALKINGQRAYKLAKKWEDFKIKSRKIEIFDIKILSFKYPKLLLKASVSSGSYIRSIASDLWNILWTWWYISYLRRTKIWDLDISLASKLDNFQKDNYLDVKTIFPKKIFIELSDDILEKINYWLGVKYSNDLLELEYSYKNHIFVINSEDIVTNIVKYDWVYLIPVKNL